MGNFLDAAGLTRVWGKIRSMIGTQIIELTDAGSTTAGTWLASSTQISTLTDGLLVRYKIVVAGASNTYLNVNNLGNKRVYRNGSTKLTTHYGIGEYVTLYYSETLNSGCWMCIDGYDANSYAYVRQYIASDNVEYPLLIRYGTGSTSNYVTEYTKFASAVTLNPSTNAITATKFIGALQGNATSATSATSATTSTNIAGGAAGSIPYQTAAGTTAFLAASANNGYVLAFNTSTGAPYWKSDANTNNAVTQTATTTNAAYEVLFSATADNTTRTEGARKTSTLTYNPSTKALSTGGAVNGLTLSAQTTGFKISGGTTSKTLTVGADYTLAAACAKAVVTSIDTSASLPTSNAVKTFVEGKGYVTSSGVTSVATSTGLTGGTITSTGTISINSTYQTYISHGESAYNSLGNYLPLAGGIMTGIISRDSGGGWIRARDNVIVKTTRTSSQGDDWHPVIGIKTSSGFWSLGSVGGESLCLSYDTDANYNAGSNSAAVINFPPASSEGTLALTSQIPTNNNQLTNGAGYIGIGSVRGNLSAWDNSSMGWGTLTSGNGYTIGVHASSSDGGDWGMAYKGGQISMQLDGWFYQNEGQYRVLDTSDAGSLSVNYANSAGYASSAGNADTVDGRHANELVYCNWSSNYDCNEVGAHAAVYRFSDSPLNAFPSASYTNMLVIGGCGSDTLTQIGGPYHSQELYFRNGTWYSDSGTIRSTSWNRIWHENNDGSGSGLDADLLDGKHASDVFNMYAGGFTPGSGSYWGKIAEYAESFTGTIDVSTTFLVTPYYGNMGIGNILVLSFRGENTSLPIIEANWILKTYSPNITITYRIVSNTLYVRIYIYHSGWMGTNIKILNSHGWASSDTSHWTLYSAVYAGNDVATFDSIPSNETPIGIGLTSLNVSSLTASGAVTAGSASDKRLKEDVKELELSRARDIILHSRPITFRWNSLASSLYSSYSGNDLGLIAQELESILPEAIGTIFGKYKRLDYTKLITPMIKIQQDHDRRIEELENKVAELTEKLKHTN